MEHIITRRRGFRKLLAFLLCMASILGLLPAQAFAMSVGQTASSWLGDQYVGSDGNHYRAPAPYTYLAYHADGTIDVHTSSGGNAYRHYMLTDSDGISHQIYCVESGIPYQDLAGYVEVPEQTASQEQATDPTETKQDDADIVLPSVDFEALRENGPDIIGWLSLPDTVLNYPVTQTDNNEYYLNHLYDGTYNKVGCLFADYENQAGFSDRNTIVYGHNMRDGSMFALLNRYDEQSYFDTHRQMYLVTPKGGYVMEIFAAFAAKPEESGSETSPWQLSWKDDGAYTTWLTAMKERSAVESDVTVTCSDKVLTLSTCTPGGTGRFLVMGKLVKVDNEI